MLMGRAGVIPFGYFTGTSPPRAWEKEAQESTDTVLSALKFMVN